jgi:uncharacterized membrane protein YhaH (DUF805 family)
MVMEKSRWSYKGRIRRTTYWLRIILSNIIVVAVYLIVNAIINSIAKQMAYNSSDDYYRLYSKFETLKNIRSVIYILGIILFIYFQIAQGIKRMQDCNKNGWYLVIPIYSFILTLTEGTRGPNQYGADPKGNQKLKDGW